MFGDYSIKLYSSGSSGEDIKKSEPVPIPIAIIYWVYIPSQSSNINRIFFDTRDKETRISAGKMTGGKWAYYDGVWRDTSVDVEYDKWIKLEAVFKDLNYVDLYIDNTLLLADVQTTGSADKTRLRTLQDKVMWVDGLYKRKYLSPEPTTTLGDKEEQSGSIQLLNSDVNPESSTQASVFTFLVNVTNSYQVDTPVTLYVYNSTNGFVTSKSKTLLNGTDLISGEGQANIAVQLNETDTYKFS